MTTRPILVAAVLAAAALALTGCATTTDATPPTPPTWSQYAGDPASPEAANPQRPVAGEPGGPPLNARGNIEKALGQTGGLTNPSDGKVAMEFAVQKISLPKRCPAEYSTTPAGMRPVALDVVVNTKDDPDNILSMVTIGNSWEYLAPDGTSINATEWMGCEYDSPQLRPNRKYTATVWVWVPADAPTDGTAALVWNPSRAGLGYEWKLTA